MASNAPLFCVRLEYERNQASPPLATQSVGADAPTRDSVRPQARLRKSIVDKSGGRLCQCGGRIGPSCRCTCSLTWQMRLATKLSNPCLIDPMSHQGINIGETISEAEWTKSVKKHQPWALESAGSSPVRCAKNARKHDREGRAQLKRGAAFQEDCAQSGAKTR